MQTKSMQLDSGLYLSSTLAEVGTVKRERERERERENTAYVKVKR